MKKGILLAAFGAMGRQSQFALKLVEEEARRRFPGVGLRWAFTSPLVRERLADARQKTDSVRKALQKMYFEKFTHVAVQPLHLIPGAEYADIVAEAESMSGQRGFAEVRVGLPLLTGDCRAAARAVLAHLPEGRAKEEAVVFMGHGAKHSAHSLYEELARAVAYEDRLVFIGTMNGSANIDAVLAGLSVSGVRVAWLLPLLAVIGRHALHDMAGNGRESWKARIEEAGITCRPVLKGMVEYSAFVNLWLDNLEQAMADGENRH